MNCGTPPRNGEARAVGYHPTSDGPGNRNEENNRDARISAAVDPGKENYYDELFCQCLELEDRILQVPLQRFLGRAVWLMRQHPRFFPAWLKAEFEGAFGYVCLRRRLYQTEISRFRYDCDMLALSHNEDAGGGRDER